VHRAGEKVFVDYSGKQPHIVNRHTGEIIAVELFTGVLGASSYTFAEATPTQELEHWIGSHIRMVEYFEGSAAIWVPDQLKSGVSEPDRYEPTINRTYAEMAEHYGAVVIPARPRRPKDKAKVESGILVVQRWILARLRNETFFTIQDLNRRIDELLVQLNDKPMQQLGVSRRELFERIDQPALRPLPATRYEIAEWKACRVNIDYHVEVDRNYYSVPYQLVHESVEARYTHTTVEILFKGKRVARPRGRRPPGSLHDPLPDRARAHVAR